MERKLQVFISSTYTDLIEERQIAVEAILNEGHIPAGMELFKAGPTQEEVIKDWIEQSDIYILILGGRYGSLNKTGISYTEWEYDLAVKMGKPMFAIVLDESYLNTQVDNKKIRATELETNSEKFKDFYDKVTGNLVKFVGHPAEITVSISGSIREIEKRRSDELVGWIPGRLLEELNSLKKENKELSDELLNRQKEYINLQKEITDFKDDYVGEYSFDFVYDELANIKVPVKSIDQRIKGFEEEIGRIELKNGNSDKQHKCIEKLIQLKENNSLIVAASPYKNIITSGSISSSSDQFAAFLFRFLYNPLKRFYLIESIKFPDYKMTENGYKFFNLLKSKENEKKE